MSELRHDPLTDRWVIISTERGERPFDIERLPKKKKSFCPFCPGNESKTPIPEIYAILKNGSIREKVEDRDYIKPDWLVRVIPNKYPALQPYSKIIRRGVGVFDKINGIGAHEICIESPEHSIEIPELPFNQVVNILEVLKFRMNDLEKNSFFQYLSIFKNKGDDAGASLEHPHFQINAYPITPSEVARELNCCKDHYNKKIRCLVCDILSQEIDSGERIIEANEAFVVLSPFAARFPGELLIAPAPTEETHNHCFFSSDISIIKMLASVLQRTLIRLMRKYNDPDYNIYIHTAPFFRDQRNGHGATIKNDYHWHLHIMPRITKIAGNELANDCYINTVTPESVAKLLREAAV